MVAGARGDMYLAAPVIHPRLAQLKRIAPM